MARTALTPGKPLLSCNVYLTEVEWRRLIAMARARRVSKSEIVRQLLRKADMPPSELELAGAGGLK